MLPKPPHPFRGTINPRVKDSKSDFPQPVKAPAGAPNILLVLLDDVGFGATSTFGGPCQTPTFAKLAVPSGRPGLAPTVVAAAFRSPTAETACSHITIPRRRGELAQNFG